MLVLCGHKLEIIIINQPLLIEEKSDLITSFNLITSLLRDYCYFSLIVVTKSTPCLLNWAGSLTSIDKRWFKLVLHFVYASYKYSLSRIFSIGLSNFNISIFQNLSMHFYPRQFSNVKPQKFSTNKEKKKNKQNVDFGQLTILPLLGPHQHRQQFQ